MGDDERSGCAAVEGEAARGAGSVGSLSACVSEMCGGRSASGFSSPVRGVGTPYGNAGSDPSAEASTGTGALRGTRCAASTFSSGGAGSDPVGGAYGLLLLMPGYYTSAGVAPVHSYQP